MIKINRTRSSLLWVIWVGMFLGAAASTTQPIDNPADIRFKRISVEEGLSQSTVFCILQDNEGFMWFGTRSGGLNRYNGYNFDVFKNDPNDSTTISNNEVVALFEDSEHQLWIGLRKGGLNKFNKQSETFIRYNHSVGNDGVSGSTVNVIFEDSRHRLWIGTNSGVDVLQNGLFLKNSVPGISNQNITSVNEDQEGNLYFTDKTGLFVYHNKSGKTQYFRREEITDEIISSNYSIPFLVDSKDQKWIGSIKGVNQFTTQQSKNKASEIGKVLSVIPYETRQIMQDSKGNLWVGTIQGLYKYNAADSSLVHFFKDENDPLTMSHNSVYSIYEDNTGIIWIGTWGGGVNMLTDKFFKFAHFKHQNFNAQSLSNNVVSSFAEDDQGVWIGTELGGLNFLSNSSHQFKSILHQPDEVGGLSSNHIKTLLKSESNLLWIGTFGGGLNRLNTKTGRFDYFLPTKKIFALAEQPKGILWVGMLDGLYQFNTKKNKWKQYEQNDEDENSLSHSFVNVLFASSSGILWIGTKEGGLMRYDADKDNFIQYKNIPNDTTSLLSNYIISLSEDKFGNLLVGTNNGLNMYNPLYHNFIEVRIDHLPDKNINGVVCDKQNNYWISTNKGITKYNSEGVTLHYDMNDGLQSNEFSRNAFLQSKDGSIYFGGINGFNVFLPSEIPVNNDIPEVLITKLKISNQIVKPNDDDSPLKYPIHNTKEITLQHYQSDLSFEFVALNYIAPDKNQYAYKLEGYNDDWIYCGKAREATYTNLKPGKYTFKVKGANNDNVWNAEGASISILINPPLWKKPIAYLFYTIVMLLLLYLLKILIGKRIEQQNMLHNERLEKKRIEELNLMKLRFFTNIAHEFRTPLTLIAGPLSQIKSYHTDNEEQSYLIGVVQNNVKRLLNLVNELMDFRKAENEKLKLRISRLEITDFLQELVECFKENAIENEIQLEFKSSLSENFECYFDKGILDKVVFNLLSNAIKHTPKNGAISVELNVIDQRAMISVIDTGEGIPPGEIDKIFDRFYQVEKNKAELTGTGIGLAYAKRLVEVHKGRLEVQSEWSKGAVFTVNIPINKEAYSGESFSYDNNDIKHSIQLPTSPLLPSNQLQGFNETDLNKKMLIVEDNNDLRNYLAFHFKDYKVLTASNGKQGLEVARKEIPDIVISDIMMPEMNGLEMCNELKSQFITSHIPVILLSARTEVSQKIEGVESGADAYIEKPFETAFLEASIKSILAQRKRLRKKNMDEPDERLASDLLNSQDKRFIERVNRSITRHIENPDFSVEVLASELGLSRSQLFRKFKAYYELSPSETIRLHRLDYAKKLISEGKYNVNEVADKAGFKSTSYFITSFKKHFGATPNDFLKSSR